MKNTLKLALLLPLITSCEVYPDYIYTYINSSKHTVHIKEYRAKGNDFTLEHGDEKSINYGHVGTTIGIADSVVIEFDKDRKIVLFKDSIKDIFGSHLNYSLILEEWKVKRKNNRKICQEYEITKKEYNVAVKK